MTHTTMLEQRALANMDAGEYERRETVAELADQYTEDQVKLALTDGDELCLAYDEYQPDFWAQLVRAFANVDKLDSISVQALREAVWNIRSEFKAAVEHGYASKARELAESEV